MAAVCRYVCGLTRLPANDGQAADASRVYLRTIRSIPSRLNRPFADAPLRSDLGPHHHDPPSH